MGKMQREILVFVGILSAVIFGLMTIFGSLTWVIEGYADWIPRFLMIYIPLGFIVFRLYKKLYGEQNG